MEAAEVEEYQPLGYRLAHKEKNTFAWKWEQTILGHVLEDTSYALTGAFVRIACMSHLKFFRVETAKQEYCDVFLNGLQRLSFVDSVQDASRVASQTFPPYDEMTSLCFEAPLMESLSLCMKFLAVAQVCEETNEKQHSNFRA